MTDGSTPDVLDPRRWGISPEAIPELAERLQGFWQQYGGCFRTTTRDAGGYVYPYVSALLRMDSQRNFANIGRQSGVPGQNVQHFMSNSPWSAQDVLRQVRREIAGKPELHRGGMLVLDESAVKKAGQKSVGAGRQWNGRLGKVDLSQVGTFLAYTNGPVWTWIDGELFLPEHWFGPDWAAERTRLGVPPERTFQTKVELGWQMIQRARTAGLPFEAFACDDLYGRSGWLRTNLDRAGIVYFADVPADTRVYLTQPTLELPPPRARAPRTTAEAPAGRDDGVADRSPPAGGEAGDLLEADPGAARRTRRVGQRLRRLAGLDAARGCPGRGVAPGSAGRRRQGHLHSE